MNFFLTFVVSQWRPDPSEGLSSNGSEAIVPATLSVTAGCISPRRSNCPFVHQGSRDPMEGTEAQETSIARGSRTPSRHRVRRASV